MTPRERLTEILNLKTTAFLEKEGFKFSPTTSKFSRTINKIKQIVYFDGNRWNHADVAADYRLLCGLEIKYYPIWYLENYNTDQSTHPQGKVDLKTIGQPSPSEGYSENWDESAQISKKYNLIKFSKEEISESIYNNVKDSIVPYLDDCSTFTGIAHKAKFQLDKFDYFMMDKNTDCAKAVLLEIKEKIDTIKIEELDFNDQFRISWLENTANQINIRINRFFPEFEQVNLILKKTKHNTT